MPCQNFYWKREKEGKKGDYESVSIESERKEKKRLIISHYCSVISINSSHFYS